MSDATARFIEGRLGVPMRHPRPHFKLLFGETPSAVRLAGFAVALAGVIIVQGIHRPR